MSNWLTVLVTLHRRRLLRSRSSSLQQEGFQYYHLYSSITWRQLKFPITEWASSGEAGLDNLPEPTRGRICMNEFMPARRLHFNEISSVLIHEGTQNEAINISLHHDVAYHIIIIDKNNYSGDSVIIIT